MNKTDYVYLIDPFKKDITLVHLPTGKLELFAGRALIVGAANEDGHSTTPTYPMDFLPVVYTSEHPEVGVTEFTVTSWETGESPVDVQLVE